MKKFYSTKAVYEKAAQDNAFRLFAFRCWARFKNNDWGDVSEQAKLVNDGDPDYALGEYTYTDGTKIWIKSDKKYATVLFPEEW